MKPKDVWTGLWTDNDLSRYDDEQFT